MTIKLTILMPCLNEAETLGICIKKAKEWIEGYRIKAEILIADNGSEDGSQNIAESLGARVINVSKKGYGNALYYGCHEALGDFIIMGDSDDSYDFSDLTSFIEKLEQGYDLVMGNRFKGGIAQGAMPWKNKYIGNPGLSWLGKLFFKCPANDFLCGLRAFRKSAFIDMDLRTTGMEFGPEMLIKATILNMKITEVPTTLSKDGRSRPPHLKPWRDGWINLRFMLIFSPKWLFLFPGLLTLSISLPFYLLILLQPVTIGSTTFDIRSLFFSEAGIVLGFLALNLSVIIKMFGVREGLLKNNRFLHKLSKFPLLEIGLSLSILMIIMGFLIGAASLAKWAEINFSNIESDNLLRMTSASSILIILGGITLMVSFIMGFLNLPTREERLKNTG
jgi:glycosyltransferase involved in cell wall biosynthesis